PLDGGSPGLVEATGWPINQFSFRDTQTSLQVFVLDSTHEHASRPSILNIPLSSFEPQITRLPQSQYRYLPPMEGDPSLSVNRFIGSNLVYSDVVEDSIGEYRSSILVKELDTNLPPVRFPLDHIVERIEPVNGVAVVMGTNYTSG